MGGGFRWFGQCPKENVFFKLRSSLSPAYTPRIKIQGWEEGISQLEMINVRIEGGVHTFILHVFFWPGIRQDQTRDPPTALQSLHESAHCCLTGVSLPISWTRPPIIFFDDCIMVAAQFSMFSGTCSPSGWWLEILDGTQKSLSYWSSDYKYR